MSYVNVTYDAATADLNLGGGGGGGGGGATDSICVGNLANPAYDLSTVQEINWTTINDIPEFYDDLGVVQTPGSRVKLCDPTDHTFDNSTWQVGASIQALWTLDLTRNNRFRIVLVVNGAAYIIGQAFLYGTPETGSVNIVGQFQLPVLDGINPVEIYANGLQIAPLVVDPIVVIDRFKIWARCIKKA